MYSDSNKYPTGNRRGSFEPIIYVRPDPFKSLIIHTGGNSNQNLTIKLPYIGAEELGIGNTSVLTQGQANNAIYSFDQAIKTISDDRSKLGALQNRLEHTKENVSNFAENLTASESRLRDADIAKEVTKLGKQHVLLQASQAMLASANQIPQGILQFLR